MERLTVWMPIGYRAIPRMDLRRNGYEKCTTRLAEYEDTGLSLEQVQQLKERDTAKIVDTSSRCEEHTHYKCPTCGNILMTVYKGARVGRITEFCEKCGQRIEV